MKYDEQRPASASRPKTLEQVIEETRAKIAACFDGIAPHSIKARRKDPSHD